MHLGGVIDVDFFSCKEKQEFNFYFFMNMEIATNFEVVKFGKHIVNLQVNP